MCGEIPDSIIKLPFFNICLLSVRDTRLCPWRTARPASPYYLDILHTRCGYTFASDYSSCTDEY